MNFETILEKENNIFELLITKFLPNQIHRLILLNKRIHSLILKWINSIRGVIVKRFDQKYRKYFQIINCQPVFIPYYLSIGKIKQVRIEFEINFKVKNTIKNKKSYILAYSYEFFDKKKLKKNSLFWEIQFDVVKNSRSIWFYKQQTRNHFTEENISQIQNIMPINMQDILCFEVAYLTNFGFSNLQKLEFYALRQQDVMDRLCEIETNFEWIPYEYYENPIQFEVEDIIKLYPQNLNFIQIRCSGVGFVNYKIKLECEKAGELGQFIDHKIAIKQKDESIKIRLKKKNSYEQRKTTLTLRVGDIVIVYFTPNI